MVFLAAFLIWSVFCTETGETPQPRQRGSGRRARKPTGNQGLFGQPAQSHGDGGCAGGVCPKDAPVPRKQKDEI